MLLNQTAIPLSQRMLLRAVSRRWKAVIEDDLMNDTSLVLRVTAYPLYSRLKRSDLIVRHIPNRNNEELFNLLARVFQGVSRLTIIGFGNALVSLCTTKFGPFGGQLEMLRMVGVFAFTMASTYEAVGETLNALTNLTSLHLNVHGLDPVLSYLGRTLASLKRFHFLDMLCNDSVGSIISASLSPTCTHLGLTYRNSDLSNRIFVNQLASSLTHLHLFRCPHNLDDINDGVEWVSQLSNLTSFSFHFYSPVSISLSLGFPWFQTTFPCLTSTGELWLRTTSSPGPHFFTSNRTQLVESFLQVPTWVTRILAAKVTISNCQAIVHGL